MTFHDGPHQGTRLGLLGDAALKEVKTWLQGCLRGVVSLEASRALKMPVDSVFERPHALTEEE